MKKIRRILAGFCCVLCVCVWMPDCAEAAWEEHIGSFGETWGLIPIPETEPAPPSVPSGDTSFYQDGRIVPTNSYILPDASSRYLTEDEIGQLTWRGVRYAINEIYARRGYIFTKKEELKVYFGKQSWYIGDTTDQEIVKSRMNSYELENVRLLVELETALWGGEYELY